VNNPVAAWLAGKHLRSRSTARLPSALTLLSLAGIVLGTATMVAVLAVSRGFREAFRDAILRAEPHLILLPLGGRGIVDAEGIVAQVAAIPGVSHAEAVVQGEVTVVSRDAMAGAFLKGPAGVATWERLRALVADGELPRPGQLLLGVALAERLGVGAGDTIAVVSFESSSGGIPLPRARMLVVAGAVDLGVYQWNASMAYAPWKDAQQILGRGGDASVIEASLGDPSQAVVAADRVAREVGGPHFCLNWMDRNRPLLDMLEVHRSVMTIILSLIVLVAAFNVASGLAMGVTSRRREIGILMALGARRSLVGRVFAVEGMVIGLVGIAVGTGSGALLALWAGRKGVMSLAPDVYQLATLPSVVRASDLLLVGGIATAVALAASLYPSLKASRVDPAEAIRYE
jgi:lipoprotein-releasing system permease protein